MKCIIALFIIFSFHVKAEVVPLPSSVMGVDEIVSEFRDIFKSKILDLGKNYISLVSDKSVVFKSSANIDCNGTNITQGQPISSMVYSFVQKNSELSEKAIYTGCNNVVGLVEDVITRGENLKPLSFNDFIKGKRSVDLKENESFKIYRISNQDNEEIFKAVIEKTSPTTKFVTLFYLGQKFFTMYYEFNLNNTKATFTVYSYSAKYVLKHASWTTEQRSYPPTSLSVQVYKDSSDSVRFYDPTGNRMSLTNFLSLFDEVILISTIARLQSILNYHTYYFPTTEVLKSGAQSQKLLEDLRIAQSRLLTNTEINLVKNLIQDLIIATESGLITDNRPKEQ